MTSGPHDQVDEYATIADVYDLWSSDMTADVPFYVGEAVAAGGPVLEVGVGTGRIALAIAAMGVDVVGIDVSQTCLLYTSPSPRDQRGSRMPSSA